jgi:hypothetical protein
MLEINGTVRLADGAPVAGIKLSVFDRGVRREQELGQSQTDKQGFYQIRYSSRQFLKAEKGSADLVKSFATDGPFAGRRRRGIGLHYLLRLR